ncbi:GyrI-like domain-containing protein [Mycoplasmatota bacterium WC44]
MSQIEFEYFEIEDMEFSGNELEVFLPEVDKVDFGSLWGGVMDKTDTAGMAVSDFTIGFEDYKNMTKENQTFIYKALAPSKYYVGEPFVKLTLKKGKYIKFKSLFREHGPSFFQKVYKYMDDEGIPFEDGFDFELMYGDFNPEDENAYCYICLKIKED